MIYTLTYNPSIDYLVTVDSLEIGKLNRMRKAAYLYGGKGVNVSQVLKELGIDSMRFHDLRHTFAVVSLESGDDIKTLQDNMGHATSAFTLDTYGHSNLEMKKRSAQKMQQFINKVS